MPIEQQDMIEDAIEPELEPLTDPGARLRPPSWVNRIERIGALELFSKYRQKVVHSETGLPFEPSNKRQPFTMEKLAFETGLGLRLALKVFMPIMAVTFAFSFYWDFYGLIRSCSVAGMIGFSTNWVAIKMLFRPREPRPIFGQGLIPQQRDDLIEKVADEVLRNLINEELIQRKIEETRIVERFSSAAIDKLHIVIEDPEFQRDFQHMVLSYVGELTQNAEFRTRLATRAERRMQEFAGSRFTSWAVNRLKGFWREPLIEVINAEIERLDTTLSDGLGHVDGVLERLPAALEDRREDIDSVLTTMLMGLVREVDVREIILEQLSTVTAEQLEKGFLEFSDDKLSFITLLGGLLGMVGGSVIVWPIPSMVVILSLLAVAGLLDLAIAPLMKSRFWPSKRRGN